ncbi:VacJ lipoprotein [Salmonella enterica subsp. arizonae]|uniref:VacJ lipoprotein n=1 Tax=Salmonella enterica subsp. arizonae TaxID=59203 RepID=A0A379S1R8_SALER|nr:VacJ lipoprotein [Salmonella enterica subsp. arizonae]
MLLKSLTPKQADTVAFVPSWMVISDSHNLQGDIYEASPVGAGAGTTLLVGCASSGTEQQGRSDPFEGFNRTMYNFNFNVLDPYVVRPVAVAWRDYVPQPARNGLSNFTGNLEEPAIMVNYFLQGDPYQGMVHFTRFFLNTLLGMGGFIDVAGMANPKLQRVEPHRFGSTLGHYGVGLRALCATSVLRQLHVA